MYPRIYRQLRGEDTTFKNAFVCLNLVLSLPLNDLNSQRTKRTEAIACV